MDVLGLILAIGLGIVELAIAWPLVLVPLKAENAAGGGVPGCAPVLSLLVLVPMTLVNTGIFLFLKADGSFVQKFGLCFGGTTVFAIALLSAGARLANPKIGMTSGVFRAMAVGGLLINFYILILLGRFGPGPVLTVDPGLALVLSIIGLPAALVLLGILSSKRASLAKPQAPAIGEVHYIPPPG